MCRTTGAGGAATPRSSRVTTRFTTAAGAHTNIDNATLHLLNRHLRGMHRERDLANQQLAHQCAVADANCDQMACQMTALCQVLRGLAERVVAAGQADLLDDLPGLESLIQQEQEQHERSGAAAAAVHGGVVSALLRASADVGECTAAAAKAAALRHPAMVQLKAENARLRSWVDALLVQQVAMGAIAVHAVGGSLPAAGEQLAAGAAAAAAPVTPQQSQVARRNLPTRNGGRHSQALPVPRGLCNAALCSAWPAGVAVPSTAAELPDDIFEQFAAAMAAQNCAQRSSSASKQGGSSGKGPAAAQACEVPLSAAAHVKCTAAQPPLAASIVAAAKPRVVPRTDSAHSHEGYSSARCSLDGAPSAGCALAPAASSSPLASPAAAVSAAAARPALRKLPVTALDLSCGMACGDWSALHSICSAQAIQRQQQAAQAARESAAAAATVDAPDDTAGVAADAPSNSVEGASTASTGTAGLLDAAATAVARVGGRSCVWLYRAAACPLRGFHW